MNDFLSIPARIFRHAQAHPDKPAIVYKDRCITYAQLVSAARALCAALKEAGLQKGECVLVQGCSEAAFAAAVYGTELAGGIAVITARRPTPESLAELTEKTDARFFLGESGTETGLIRYDFEALFTLPDPGGPVDFPTVDQPANMIFTTGTTGKSKGVLHSAGVAAACAENLVQGAGYEADTVYLIYAPMNHAFGLRKMDSVMFVGGTIVFCDGMKNIRDIFEALENKGVNALHLLPSAARTLFALTRDRLGRFAGQIRFVESGAEPFPEADRERLMRLLPNSRLYFGYGSSEADDITKYCYSEAPGLSGCVGKVNHLSRLRFVDETGADTVPTAENPGLVVCGGPTVMLGYWREPELTASVLKDGWIYTSDLGYLDEEGRLRLMGRKGDVINVGGIKVACSELEEHAMAIEGVAEAACIAVEDKMSGQAPKLFVVMEPGVPFSKDFIKTQLSRRLEHYKLPRQILCLDSLPRAANGKVLKRELEKAPVHT